MTVASQLRLAIALLVIALTAILLAAFYVPSQLQQSAKEAYVEDVIPLRDAVQDLRFRLANQEAAVEEYLRTNDDAARQDFYSEVGNANAALRKIQQHAAGHPELDPLLRDATSRIGDLQRLSLQRITPDAPRGQRVAAERGYAQAFERFGSIVDQLLARTDTYADRADREQRNRYEQLLFILGGLGFVALGIGLALFLVVPRRVGQLYEAEQHSRREAESRADAARALAHVSDGVILTDGSGRVRFWNPAAEELTGIDENGAIGRELARLLPGWERLARQPEATDGLGGAAVLPIHLCHERWLSVMSADFGEGVVYAVRDVTEERALDTLRSEFVATASHELRTPMTSISGAARTLLRHGDRLSRNRHQTFLEMIVAESDRLSRIVDQILVASRIEAGRIDVMLERTDAGEIARSIVDNAQMGAPDNIRFEVTAPEDVEIECDPDRLRQVLGNIVDNAIKYSPNGGRILVEVAADGENVRFAVHDEGIGFDASSAETIFERFRRLDPHQTHGIGGTGLGLYISRELVRRMGGRVWAESARGRGASFYVELPLADAVQAPQEQRFGTAG
jgi:two-component system, OmpR family, phosphate regulon sensor histidine kinase PhoR